MCVSWSAGGLLLLIRQAKGHPKNEKQNKPIERMKIFKGRVAPPPWGIVHWWATPPQIFFEIFFCSNSFSKFFSDFCFIC